MAFNNLPCMLIASSDVPSTPESEPPAAAALTPPASPSNAITDGQLVVQYAPIEFVNLPLYTFATTFTQILVK